MTGVVATDTGSGVSLTAADGRNITVALRRRHGAPAATVADFGLAAAATTGGDDQPHLLGAERHRPAASSSPDGDLHSTNAIASTGTALSAIDISTLAGANAALSAIDAALTAVNSSRAALGAIQNRFSSTIENLQTSART